MNTCATCLHLVIGRARVRCGQRWAPREALPHLEACERYERADDALNAPRDSQSVVIGPWSINTPPPLSEAPTEAHSQPSVP